MRVAIVDDEQRERDTLQEYLRRFADTRGCCFTVDVFTSADALLGQYQMVYDILIFDIDMPGTNGIEAARKIRQIDRSTILLFVTNIAQYAINGYEVDAIDYIIKPIGYYDFAMKFQRAVSKAAQRADTYMVLKTVDGGTRRINVSQIVYVEVLGHYLSFHLADTSCRVRGNIRDYEQQLRPYNFCQIHKSYLVNMEHIEAIHTNELQLKDTALSIGRVYKEELLQRYFKFVRG